MAQNQNLPRTFQMEQSILDNIKVFLPHTSITLQDLRNPTSEVVSRVYACFLEELGVNIVNLLQIQNNQMTLIAHVDMYNVSVPMLNQYHCINFFLKRMGIETFSVTDLVTPSSKRTLFFFDAILKFLSYCDDRIAGLQPELERLRDLEGRRKELLSKIEVLRNEINHRASARSQRRDKIKELDKLINVESQKFESIIQEKQGQVAAVNSIKKLLEEDTERESELIRTIKKIEEDVTGLRGMIVKSPMKLKHSVDEQNQKKAELLLNMKNLKNQIEEKKRLTQTIEEQQLKQEERFQKMRDILEMKMNIKEKELEIIDLLDQIEKMQERCDEKKLHIVGQQERGKLILDNVEEHRRRKEKQDIEGKELVESAEKDLEDLKNQRVEKVKYSNEMQMLINQIIEDLQLTEKEFLAYQEREKDAHQKLESKEQHLILKYKTIMNKLRQINENLEKRFGPL